MNISIIDPGLITKAGHHFDIDQKIINNIGGGNNIRIVAPINCDPEVKNILERSGLVIPAIRRVAYSILGESSTAENELDDFTASSNELASLLVKLSDTTDFFVFPTLFPAQLHACASAELKAPIAGCIQLNANFQSAHIGSALWRGAYTAAKDADLRINLGAFEPTLLQEYQSIFGLDINLFSVPYEGMPSKEPEKILKTIGILGHQRQEKGSNIFDQLVGALVLDGYSIVMQDSTGQIKSKHPSIKDCGYVEDLGALMRGCDLILLPYMPEHYRFRGSGILWEAIANGVPVLCPDKTALSENLKDLNIGSTFDEYSVKSIVNKVRECGDDYPRLISEAGKVAYTWGESHGVTKFIESLTDPRNFGV